MYTLINLDITYKNIDNTSLTINNISLPEEPTIITNIKTDETITLSAGQFIFSENSPTRIFGDDFNFIWPKLRPGINQIYLDGDGVGKGRIQFTYRYPIKIGDGAIDVEKLGRNPICEGDISGIISSIDGITTLARKNVMFVDGATNTSYAVFVQDGDLHITETSATNNKSITLVESNTDTLHEITVKDSFVYLSALAEVNNDPSARDAIILIDETDNSPYEVTVKDNTPDDSTDANYNLYLSKI